MSLNGTNEIHSTNIFNIYSANNNITQHERSFSSDETILLSLPNKSISETMRVATIHDCPESDLMNCNCSLYLNKSTLLLASRGQNHLSDDSSNTSSTTIPENNVRYCLIANDPYQSILSECSSSDEHTSFYDDKVSRVSSIPIDSTSHFHTPSDSCNGAYLFTSVSYIFPDISKTKATYHDSYEDSYFHFYLVFH